MRDEKGPLLGAGQARALLAFARKSIAQALHMRDADKADKNDKAGSTAADTLVQEPVFDEKRAVFVTLLQQQRLRGCIGSLEAVESLRDSVRRNAVRAALHDPRFSPLTPRELGEVVIEISVLTAPQVLEYHDAAHLLQLLEPGRDGLIVQGPHGAQATFLPQVWQQLPGPEQFLTALCRKAELPEEAWKTGRLGYLRYRVESYKDHDEY